MAIISNFDKIVLLQDFANYFNRKIFYYAALSDYLANAENYYVRTDINFNPNDGIRTTLDALEYVEDSVGNLSKEFDMKTINYLLVVDPSKDVIKSRWWVVSITRTRNGLYNLKLKRDTVAEVINENDFLVNTPVYVEKGHLENDDPYIVNSENLTFNQIKRGETLLKENKIGGWIVGYMSNDADGTFDTYKRDNPPAEYITSTTIATATGIPESIINNLDQTPVWFASENGVIDIIIDDDNPLDDYVARCRFNSEGFIVDLATSSKRIHGSAWMYIEGMNISSTDDQNARNLAGLFQDDIEDDLVGFNNFIKNAVLTHSDEIYDSGYHNFYLYDIYNKLLEYTGQILYKGGKYYRISFDIVQKTNGSELYRCPYGENPYFDTISQNVCNYFYFIGEGYDSGLYESSQYYVEFASNLIQMVLEEIPNTVFRNEIPSSHNILMEAPYSMFAIPLNGMKYIETDNTEHSIPMADDEILAAASAIATGLDAKLYDIQLLPYCPCPEFLIDNGNKAQLSLLTEGKDFSRIKDSNLDTKGLIFYPVNSRREFIIDKTITATYPPKIESQVAFCRLCSPNYSGVFEFNLAKNNNVSHFYVDITYKPFNPFIHVVPQFRFLYGDNYKDGRGLICGGEFSLPIVKDRWVEYELNNKNYNAIFARDIQNMDFRHRQEEIMAPFKAFAGTVGAGAGGAVAGFKMGGGYGAAAGAALGTVAGGIGGAIDLMMGQERRAEEKDYAIDRFNLQLGNIKALPQSLSRVSSFTNINKIFPFIEYYTATEEEVAALEEKIKYDGMTVGRIDKVLYYTGGNESQYYFKGQMIRSGLGNYDEDFCRDLYEELAKGVYI